MSGDRITLRDLLRREAFVRVVGVHDGMGAILATRAGFEALWAGGLGISLAYGLPDAGLLTMTEFHAEAVRIRRSAALPVVADVDSGYGDVNVVRRMVRLYEDAGIDAVCIEDKQYPKRNSFRDGNVLEEPEVFASKLRAAKLAQKTDEFMVIARIESLIAGAGMVDALERAALYRHAGADAFVIHSRSRTVVEIAEFCTSVRARGVDAPILTIPTTYYNASGNELRDLGACGAIYANQVLRATVRATQDLLATLAYTGSTAPAEAMIAPVSELFDLVGTQHLDGDRPWVGLDPRTIAPDRH